MSYLLIGNYSTRWVNLCSTPRCGRVSVCALIVLNTLVGEGEYTLCTTESVAQVGGPAVQVWLGLAQAWFGRTLGQVGGKEYDGGEEGHGLR